MKNVGFEIFSRRGSFIELNFGFISVEYYVVPTPFEKRLLVFTGTYASLKEVPDLVT